MKLKNLAAHYDRDKVYDAYTGAYLFKAQFSSFDGSQLDGSFIRRRTVSMRPEYVLPPRRVITLYGEQWVLSEPIKDGFNSAPVRQTMSARKCHGLYQIKTAHELALGITAPRSAYAYRSFVRATQDATETYMEPYTEFSFALTEASMDKCFIVQNSRVWSPRFETDNSEGFKYIEADEVVSEGDVSESYVQVQGKKEYDPVEMTEISSLTFTALLIDRYVLFKKLDQAQESNYAGDKTLIVSKSSDPNPQGYYDIGTGRWSILALHDLGDGWAVHVRKIT